MIEFGLPLVLSAFVAGVAMFFAPCTLPLAPAFLASIAGVDIVSLQKAGAHDSALHRTIRRKMFRTAIVFVFGFSLVFIVLGAGAGGLGHLWEVKSFTQKFAGAVMILFGTSLLGILPVPGFSSGKFLTGNPVSATFGRSRWRKPLPALNAFLAGAAFGFAWSPCVGPILGSVLFLAAGTATFWQGIILLAVFALGQAIPFLIIAWSAGRAFSGIIRLARAARIINICSGIFLIVFGLLLLTNWWLSILGWLGAWVMHFPAYESFVNRFL